MKRCNPYETWMFSVVAWNLCSWLPCLADCQISCGPTAAKHVSKSTLNTSDTCEAFSHTKCIKLDLRTSTKWNANFSRMGKTGKQSQWISDRAVAVAAPSERLCVCPWRTLWASCVSSRMCWPNYCALFMHDFVELFAEIALIVENNPVLLLYFSCGKVVP